MRIRILIIVSLLSSLSGCVTQSHNKIKPPQSSAETTAKNINWVYKLTPIKSYTYDEDGSSRIWHSKISIDTYPTEVLCLEAAAKGLEYMGGEAWNLKAECLSPPPISEPIAISIADDIELEQ